MERDRSAGSVSRRNFVKYTAMLAVGGRTFLNSGDARAAIYAARDGRVEHWQANAQRRLPQELRW